MPFTVTMPKLSPTMEEGVIAKWQKKEGDFVRAGETLLEITTDKATVEHNAIDEGWLKKILVREGENAQLNQPIAIFTESEDESIKGYEPEGVQPKKAEAQKKENGREKKSEKPEARVKEETEVKTFREPLFAPPPPLKDYHFEFPREAVEKRIAASPLAKRLAKEQGLDLTTVKGTGPGGRILERDLELAQPEGIVPLSRRDTPTIPPGTYEEIPLSPMRKIVGKRLQESKTFIPHFYVKQVVDADAIVALREQLKKLDIKVTYNDLVIRACALALRKHPEINSGFNSANQTLLRFKTIDISVAVQLDEGLITPIIRYADYKSLSELAVEMRLLAEKARQGKLKEEEYKGGSFCVSNLGMFGITEFIAVINPPQAAILAVGGIEEAAVIKDGKVVPGKTLSLILSADHRVIDGADAARFLKTVQFLLENPASLTI